MAMLSGTPPLTAAEDKLQTAVTGRQNVRFEVHVTPEMKRHSTILDVLYFTRRAWSVAVFLFLLRSGLSRRLWELSRRMVRPLFIAWMLYFILLSAAVAVLHLPLWFYGGYMVPHQFALTDQTFASWFGDLAKAVAAESAVGSVVAALGLAAIARFRRWWLTVWLGSIPFMIIGVVIAPIFFDPLFNRFEPLRDPKLKTRLVDTAARAGIEGSRIYQVDRSKQTKTMNAYVTGIGPTKRIVLWDTLLQKLTEDEIVATMGHEMGHYILHHLWKGLAFGFGISFVICILAQPFYDRGVARYGAAWRLEGPADPAALPWLLLIVTVIGFFLAPAINGYSRQIEHEADRFGLQLTRLNEATATSFVKFAEDSKVNPRPHPFIRFWRYSHPPLAERIEFALGYGRPRRADVAFRSPLLR